MMQLRVLSLLVFIFIFAVGCNDVYTICDQSRTSTVNGSFYRVQTGTELLTPAPSLNVYVLNGPQVITNAVAQESIALQLTPGIDSLKFTVRTSNTAPLDTVNFKYSTQTVRLSEYCGDISQFTLLQVTTTKYDLDSVVIVNQVVNTKLARNIKIYY